MAANGTPSSNGTLSSCSQPLVGRVAIITGASRGIGREIALNLALLGANVVLGYTSASSAVHTNLLANKINASSPSTLRAIVHQVNVSDPLQVQSLFDRAEEAFQTPPHIVVNSAGVLDSKYPTIANTSIEDFDTTFNVNTRGAFLVAREAANRLKRGGGGRIILLSSSMVGGLRVGFGAYAASKAAIETMVKIMAKELKGTKITANCVAPGPIATQMFFDGKTEEQVERTIEECPLSRLGETEDIVPFVAFLAGDGSEWINGQTVRINGGYV